jgi:hypothetical protein
MPTGPTSYPTALDSFPTVLDTTYEDDVGFEHDLLLDWAFTAIEAQQSLVGTVGSASKEHPIVQQLIAMRSEIASLRALANENRVNVDALLNGGSGGTFDALQTHLTAEVFGS